FCPTNKELSTYQEWKGYWEEAQRLMEEMNQALQQFPYSAAEMISDPEKTAAYREELEVRLRMARDKSAHRKREIRAMIERGTGYE
ncbi:MAG: hypothetical protein IJC85_07280, partial [Oscillospiraceae bacterium]|nr:hypothetical protein [Oscillospiraceae bacterium]